MAFDYEAKIAALLNKAEARGTTPEESEALSAAAERLMVRYAIDRANIAARRAASSKPETIVTLNMVFHGEYRDAYSTMANSIISALGNVRCYVQGGKWDDFRKPGRPFYIVGFQSDAEAARTLITSLQLQAAVAMNSWWKQEREARESYNQGERTRARRQFLTSFGAGAGHRITEARRAAMAEAEDKAPGTELVVRDRKAEVDEFFDRLGLSSARARRTAYDFAAQVAGREAGRRANTGDKAVGNPRKALA